MAPVARAQFHVVTLTVHFQAQLTGSQRHLVPVVVLEYLLRVEAVANLRSRVVAMLAPQRVQAVVFHGVPDLQMKKLLLLPLGGKLKGLRAEFSYRADEEELHGKLGVSEDVLEVPLERLAVEFLSQSDSARNVARVSAAKTGY